MMLEEISSRRASTAGVGTEGKRTSGSEKPAGYNVVGRDAGFDAACDVTDRRLSFKLPASHNDVSSPRPAAASGDGDCVAFGALLELPFLCGYLLEFVGAPDIYATLAATCKALRAAVLSSPHWELVAIRGGLLSCLVFEPKGLLSERRSKGRVRVARLPSPLLRSASAGSPFSLACQYRHTEYGRVYEPWRKTLFPGLHSGIPCLRVGLQPTPQAFLIGFRLLSKEGGARKALTAGSPHCKKCPPSDGASWQGAVKDLLNKATPKGSCPGFKDRHHSYGTDNGCCCDSIFLEPLFARVAVRSLDMSSANAEIDDGLPASVLREVALLQQVEDQRRWLRARSGTNLPLLGEQRDTSEESIEGTVSEGNSRKPEEGLILLDRLDLRKQDTTQELRHITFHEKAGICGEMRDSLHDPHVVQFIGAHISGKKLHLVTGYADGNLQDFWAALALAGYFPLGEEKSPPRSADCPVSRLRRVPPKHAQRLREVHRELVWRVLQQVLHGLAFLHSHGIIHRNLKPENILVHLRDSSPLQSPAKQDVASDDYPFNEDRGSVKRVNTEDRVERSGAKLVSFGHAIVPRHKCSDSNGDWFRYPKRWPTHTTDTLYAADSREFQGLGNETMLKGRHLQQDEIDSLLPDIQIQLTDFGSGRLLENIKGAYTPENPKDRERSYRESRRQFYRAPELLFMRGDGYTNSAPIYSLSVDIWSVAVIFMELALLQPPFRADCEMVYLLEVFRTLGTPTKPRAWVDICGLPSGPSSSKIQHLLSPQTSRYHVHSLATGPPPFERPPNVSAATNSHGVPDADPGPSSNAETACRGQAPVLFSSATASCVASLRNDCGITRCSPKPRTASESTTSSSRIAGSPVPVLNASAAQSDAYNSSCRVRTGGSALLREPTPVEGTTGPEPKTESPCHADVKATARHTAASEENTVHAASETSDQLAKNARNFTSVSPGGDTQDRSAASLSGNRIRCAARVVNPHSEREEAFSCSEKRQEIRSSHSGFSGVSIQLTDTATTERPTRTRSQPSPASCNGCHVENSANALNEEKSVDNHIRRSQPVRQLFASRESTGCGDNLAGYITTFPRDDSLVVVSAHGSSAVNPERGEESRAERDNGIAHTGCTGSRYGAAPYLSGLCSEITASLGKSPTGEKDGPSGTSSVHQPGVQVPCANVQSSCRESKTGEMRQAGGPGRRRESERTEGRTSQPQRRWDRPEQDYRRLDSEDEMPQDNKPREDLQRRKASSQLSRGYSRESGDSRLAAVTSVHTGLRASSRSLHCDQQSETAACSRQNLQGVATQSGDPEFAASTEANRTERQETGGEREPGPAEGRGRRQARRSNPAATGRAQGNSPAGLEEDEHSASSTSSNDTPLDSELDPYSEEKIILTEAVDWISQLPLWPALNWDRVLSRVREREETEKMSRNNTRESQGRVSSSVSTSVRAVGGYEGTAAALSGENQENSIWRGRSPTVSETKISHNLSVARAEHNHSSFGTGLSHQSPHKKKHYGEELVFRFGCVMGVEGVELLRDMLRIKPHERISAASAYQRVLDIVETNRTKRLHRTSHQCRPQRTTMTSSACSKALPETRTAEKPAAGVGPWTTEIEETQNTKKPKRRRAVEMVQHNAESLTGECGNCMQGIHQEHPSVVDGEKTRDGKNVEPESEDTTTGGEEDTGISSCPRPEDLSSRQGVGLPSRSIMWKRARTELPEESLHHNKADSQGRTCSIADAASQAQTREREKDRKDSATRLDHHMDTNKFSERSGDQAKDYTKPGEREFKIGESERDTGERPKAHKQGQEKKKDKGMEEAEQHRAHIQKGGHLSTGETALVHPREKFVPPSSCFNEFSGVTQPSTSCSSSSSQPLFHPSPSLLEDTCSDGSTRQSPVTSPCCSPGTYICENGRHPVTLQPPLPSALFTSNPSSSPSFPASPSCLPSSSLSSLPVSTHPSPSVVFPSPVSSSVSPTPSPSFPSFSGALPCQCSSAPSSERQSSLTFHLSSPFLAPFPPHSSPMKSSSSSSSSLPPRFSSNSPTTSSLPTISTPSSWPSILRLCRLNPSETQIPLERTMRKVAQDSASLAIKDLERCLLTKIEKRLAPTNREHSRGIDVSVPNKQHSEKEEKEEEAVASVTSECDTHPVKNEDLPTTTPSTEENEKRTAQNSIVFRNETFYKARFETPECISGVGVNSEDLHSSTSPDNRRPARRGRRRSLDDPSAHINPYGRRSPEQRKESCCKKQEEEVKKVAYEEKERSSLCKDEIETAVISMLEKTRCRSMDLIFHLRREFDLTSSTTHLAASLFHRFFCQSLLPALLLPKPKKGNQNHRVPLERTKERPRSSSPFLFYSTAKKPSSTTSPVTLSPSIIPSLVESLTSTSSSSSLLNDPSYFASSSASSDTSSTFLPPSSPSSYLSTFFSSYLPFRTLSSSSSPSFLSYPQRPLGAQSNSHNNHLPTSFPSSSPSSSFSSLLRHRLYTFTASSHLRLVFCFSSKEGRRRHRSRGESQVAPVVVAAQPSCTWLRRVLLSAATCTKLADVYNERSLEYYKTTNGDDYSHELNQWMHRLHFKSDCLNGHIWCCCTRAWFRRREEPREEDDDDEEDEQDLTGHEERENTGEEIGTRQRCSKHEEGEEERGGGKEKIQVAETYERAEEKTGTTHAPVLVLRRSETSIEEDEMSAFQQEVAGDKSTRLVPMVANEKIPDRKVDTQVPQQPDVQMEKETNEEEEESEVDHSKKMKQEGDDMTGKEKERRRAACVFGEGDKCRVAYESICPTRKRQQEIKITPHDPNPSLPGRRVESSIIGEEEEEEREEEHEKENEEKSRPCRKKLKLEGDDHTETNNPSLFSPTTLSTRPSSSSSSQPCSTLSTSSSSSSSSCSHCPAYPPGQSSSSSSSSSSTSSARISTSSSSSHRSSRRPPPPLLSSLFFSPSSRPVTTDPPVSPVSSSSSCAWLTPVSCRDVVETEKEILLALSFRLAVSTSSWCLSVLWSITDDTIREARRQEEGEKERIEKKYPSKPSLTSSVGSSGGVRRGSDLPSTRCLAKCRRYSEILADISLYHMYLAGSPPLLLAQVLHLSAFYNFFPERFWRLLSAEASLFSSLQSSFSCLPQSFATSSPVCYSPGKGPPADTSFSSSSFLQESTSLTFSFFLNSSSLFEPLFPLLGPLMLPFSRRLLCNDRSRSVHTLLKLLMYVEELPTVVRAHQELRDSPLFRLSSDLAPAPLSFLKFCGREHEKKMINLRLQRQSEESRGWKTFFPATQETGRTDMQSCNGQITLLEASQQCTYTSDPGSVNTLLSTTVAREKSDRVNSKQETEDSCASRQATIISKEEAEGERNAKSIQFHSKRDKVSENSCKESSTGAAVGCEEVVRGTEQVIEEKQEIVADVQHNHLPETTVSSDKLRWRFLRHSVPQIPVSHEGKAKEKQCEDRVRKTEEEEDNERENKRIEEHPSYEKIEKAKEARNEDEESQPDVTSPLLRDGLPRAVLTLLLGEDNPNSLRTLLWYLGKNTQL